MSERVLLVDDVCLAPRVTSITLRNAGDRVTTCDSAEDRDAMFARLGNPITEITPYCPATIQADA